MAGGARLDAAIQAALPGIALDHSDHTLLAVAPAGTEAAELNQVLLPLLLQAGVPPLAFGAGDKLEAAWMARGAEPR